MGINDISYILIITGIYIYILVGGLEHFSFFHILGIIIPTDFHIFQRGRYTTNQYIYTYKLDNDISPTTSTLACLFGILRHGLYPGMAGFKREK